MGKVILKFSNGVVYSSEDLPTTGGQPCSSVPSLQSSTPLQRLDSLMQRLRSHASSPSAHSAGNTNIINTYKQAFKSAAICLPRPSHPLKIERMSRYQCFNLYYLSSFIADKKCLFTSGTSSYKTVCDLFVKA